MDLFNLKFNFISVSQCLLHEREGSAAFASISRLHAVSRHVVQNSDSSK